MGKGYILVEGHGELGAVDNLISRLSEDLGLRRVWSPAIRWKNLHLARGVEQGANFVRTKPDTEALLILRDEDDKCPKELAPAITEWVRGLRLPFPSAVVLFRPEYEVLFLPCRPDGGEATRHGRVHPARPPSRNTMGRFLGVETRDQGVAVRPFSTEPDL